MLAVKRASFKNRCKLASGIGIMMNCVTVDLRSVQNILHYQVDGTAIFEFILARQIFLLPRMFLSWRELLCELWNDFDFASARI